VPAASQSAAAQPSSAAGLQGGLRVETGALMCQTWPGNTQSSSGDKGSGSGLQTEAFLDCFDHCALGCGKVAEFLRSALTKALAT